MELGKVLKARRKFYFSLDEFWYFYIVGRARLRPEIGLGFFERVLVGEKIVGETEEEVETLLSGFGLSRLCLK
jgi:hypothetical protein